MKIVYIILGCLSLTLGVLGVILPLLPAFPFLLFAAFCFGKSSEKLHNWFVGTSLYKKNLESYVKKRGMTKRTKLKIITMVTLLMGFGFIMMSEVIIGRVVLAVVWFFHLYYFAYRVKTLQEEEEFAS